MDKVILTKEHAEILEKLLWQGYSKEDIVHIQSREGWNGSRCEKLLDLTLDEVCKALYVGYEVEGTKEEIILEAYEYCNGFNDKKLRNFYQRGMYDLLNLLNMKVKGINE